MRIGTTIGLHLDGPQTLDDVVDEARTAAAAGLSSVWTNQVTSWDALTALTVTGLAVADIALGASTLEIALTPDGDGTLLHLRHTGLPPNLEHETRQGWNDYLGHLRRTAESHPDSARDEPWSRAAP